MSAIGTCALFYSVTLNPGQTISAVSVNPIGLNIGEKAAAPKQQTSHAKKLQRSSSTAPGLYSYVPSPSDVFKRYIFGLHAKTKRSLAEEAECGNEVSVHSWIREGVDPNELDAYGYTPLINASALGRVAAVKELLKSGAEVNKTGPFGFTALHAAAQSGHREVVSLLLRNGADINAQNDDLDTPMHLALVAERFEIVYLLLRSGANSKVAGFNKKTCVQSAKELGYYDLSETLKNYNAFGGNHSISVPASLTAKRSFPRF